MHGTTSGNGFSKSVLSLRKKQEEETIPKKMTTFGIGGPANCDAADKQLQKGKRLFPSGPHMQQPMISPTLHHPTTLNIGHYHGDMRVG